VACKVDLCRWPATEWVDTQALADNKGEPDPRVDLSVALAMELVQCLDLDSSPPNLAPLPFPTSRLNPPRVPVQLLLHRLTLAKLLKCRRSLVCSPQAMCITLLLAQPRLLQRRPPRTLQLLSIPLLMTFSTLTTIKVTTRSSSTHTDSPSIFTILNF
jgi:hypothetical protein